LPVTFSITVVLALRVPEVAVIMIGELVTTAAMLAADTVIVEVPVEVWTERHGDTRRHV
jgi:hypothetical protein